MTERANPVLHPDPSSSDHTSTITNLNREECYKTVSFTVVHNRDKYPFILPETTNVSELKEKLEPLTHVPVSMQKLIYRGMLSDTAELGSLNISAKDGKLMLVGASLSEAEKVRQIESVHPSGGDSVVAEDGPRDNELNWCEHTEHKRILERFGKPENAMVGILNSDELLSPNDTLIGLYDKRGRPLRLRIKADTCELWLATSDVTQKFPLATVHDVISQPIQSHPGYHIMAFQLGPTPKSRYFVYWMPSQYVESIKTMVLQHKIMRLTGHAIP